MLQELLTCNELAARLKITRRTVYRMLREGRIPCQRVGGQWRFVWEEVIESLKQEPGSRIPRCKNAEGSKAGA